MDDIGIIMAGVYVVQVQGSPNFEGATDRDAMADASGIPKTAGEIPSRSLRCRRKCLGSFCVVP